ncbi:MAG TPA: hypothetical protein VFH99_02195 [Candidatus Saccharimonadales bacterium]|nr:hypothetical protein [Candidatus Saccharimonadales bacterium]
MKGETVNPEIGRMSFDELGAVIAEYEFAEEPYNQALFVNRGHDDPDFPTISGQDLADWKKEFPRVDDTIVAQLKENHQAAQERIVESLGLEDAEVVPGLVYAFNQEKNRQNIEQDDNMPDGLWKGLVISSSPFAHEPLGYLQGIITMAKLTGRSYTVSTGFNNGYEEVSPTDSIEDILPKLQELGLVLPDSNKY